MARHCPAGVRQWACGGGLLRIVLEPWGAWVRLRLAETVAGAKRFDGDGSCSGVCLARKYMCQQRPSLERNASTVMALAVGMAMGMW